MHHSRLVVFLATLAVLCACSSASSTTSRPSATASGSTSASPCPATTDRAEPGSPQVQIQPTGVAASTITKTVTLTCHAYLTVSRSGSAMATFGNEATCTLSPGSSTGGILVSRYPKGSFFSLDEGQVICYFSTPNVMPVMICNAGELYLSGQPSVIASCSSNNIFRVEVHTGSVLVRYPHGSRIVYPNHRLTYNIRTGAAPLVVQIKFKPDQIAVFDRQAQELGLSISGT